MSKENFRLQKHTLPSQHIRQYPRALSQHQEDTLFIAVNQYTPHDNPYPKPGDVTIIAAHANGVGKELYEPLWDDLYKESKRTGAFKMGTIFIADVAWQGESGVLNEGKLGNDPSWYDHPRDLLHLINHFRNQIHRPIVAVGHSMGGLHMVELSLIHPRLFTSLVLLDPVIDRLLIQAGVPPPSVLSTFRRDIWPSRAEAAKAFKNNKFYQAWDSRVLDKWIEHGLRELPTLIYPKYPGGQKKDDPPPAKPVTLTTTKHQEVFTFTRPLFPEDELEPHRYGDVPPSTTHPDLPAEQGMPRVSFYRPEPILTFDRLPNLRPPTYFIFAEFSDVSHPDSCKAKIESTGYGVGGNGGVRGGGVKHLTIPKAGHFFPFERPAYVAELIAKYIKGQVEEWERQDNELARSWAKKDIVARTTFSKRFVDSMKALAPSKDKVKSKI